MAQVGDKYLVEIAEVIEGENKIIYRAKGFDTLVFDEYGLGKLEKYESASDLLKKEITTKMAEAFSGLTNALKKIAEDGTWEVKADEQS